MNWLATHVPTAEAGVASAAGWLPAGAIDMIIPPERSVPGMTILLRA